MSLSYKKISSILPILILFACVDLFAGTFQGGGGGRTNAAVKRYLDTRVYGLDGARKMVAPKIMLTNACLDGNSIHTIEPVWQCKEFKMVNELIESDDFNRYSKVKRCNKKVKDHLQKSFNPTQKVCEVEEAKLIDGQVKTVCTQFAKDKFKKFQTDYQLDVYRLSIGNGGTALYPRIDTDFFERTIKYTIPTCEELNIK